AFFDPLPDGERIDARLFAVDGGHENVASERFLDLTSEDVRNLQPAFFVNRGRCTASKAIHLDHSYPLLARNNHAMLGACVSNCQGNLEVSYRSRRKEGALTSVPSHE